ncbi:hypothetical protein GN316_06985 [Xylophilus sp. Kf1]|nr:hypothetical protein [Xylophilus sp. Kf1]
MPESLRVIAVHAEETASGKFIWVLTERSGTQWTELDRAPAADRRYHVALADGLLALQALVEDLDVGPREKPAAPEPAPADEGADAEPDHRSKSGSMFGFGPVR